MQEVLIAGSAADYDIYRSLVFEVRDYAIFIISTDGYIRTWNKGAENIKGYTAAEIIGKHISTFYTEEDNCLQIPIANLKLAEEKGSYECEGWRRRKDGTLFWADIVFTPLHNTQGVLIGFAKVTKEITNRKHEEDKFKGLLEAAPDAVVITNNNGQIVLINKQTEKLFGYDRLELIGKKVEDLIPEEKRKNHITNRDKYSHAPATRPMGQHSKLAGAKKDGTTFPVEISLSPITLSSETLFQASVRDCTERAMLMEALERNNEELRLLAAHVESVREEERTSISREMHDQLGSQLSALKMDLSFINKKIPGDIEPLKLKLQSANKLVDDIIKTVRKISAELRPGLLDDLGLPDAIRWYSNDFVQRTDISLIININVPQILLPDNIATTFFRIYQESLNNILKHAGATIVEVDLNYQEGLLNMTVTDNGKGFDIAKTATTKTLGLLGIKERMALINGQANVESTKGKGTCISIQAHVNKDKVV